MYISRASVEVRVARTRDELEQAFSLVYREYTRKGYADANPAGLRFSLYNALPGTATFVGFSPQHQVVATATIVPDSSLGLPIDTIYETEVTRLRKTGARLCEVTMLAANMSYLDDHALSLAGSSRLFMFSLFKRLLDYADTVMKCDYMCIAIHPKHNRLFKELLFRNLGPVKLYPEVNFAPAVGKFINIHLVKDGFSRPGKERLYDIFVRQAIASETFDHKMRLSGQDLRYFFQEKSDILQTTPESHRAYIQSCYDEHHAAASQRRLTGAQ